MTPLALDFDNDANHRVVAVAHEAAVGEILGEQLLGPCAIAPRLTRNSVFPQV